MTIDEIKRHSLAFMKIFDAEDESDLALDAEAYFGALAFDNGFRHISASDLEKFVAAYDENGQELEA